MAKPNPIAPPPPAALLAPDGRPARLPRDANCPRCGASAEHRVPSAGFGTPIEVCQRCAYEFKE